ncbi:plasmid stabilization system protein ParE [Rhizobium leguminosarum]
MAYRIVYHPKAEAELDKLYADIAVEAGTGIAGDFVHAVMTFIEALETFPERGRCGKAEFPAFVLSATGAASAWRSRSVALTSTYWACLRVGVISLTRFRKNDTGEPTGEPPPRER